jgi:hypothetical protein
VSYYSSSPTEYQKALEADPDNLRAQDGIKRLGTKPTTSLTVPGTGLVKPK